MPFDRTCQEQPYGRAISILCSSHAINSVRLIINSQVPNQILRWPHLQFRLHLFEKIFDFLGSIYHVLACMIAHDWFHFTTIGENCTEAEFGLTRRFLQLEIYIFYLTIAGTVLFLLISKIQLKNSGLMYLEKENTDFLNKYSTMNGFYSTFFLTLAITCFLWYVHFRSFQETDGNILDADFTIKWPEGEDIFLFILLMLMIWSHLNQFLAVNLQLFTSASFRQSRPTCMALTQGWLVVIVPTGVTIIEIVWLAHARSNSYDTIYYKYIAADVFINIIAGWAYLSKL